MNLCANGHDEVCYGDRTRECPVCRLRIEAEAEMTRQEEEINQLVERVDELQSKVEELS